MDPEKAFAESIDRSSEPTRPVEVADSPFFVLTPEDVGSILLGRATDFESQAP